MSKNNGYQLSRAWFDFAFENCDKVNANHTALYLFMCEINNRLGWIEQFQITSTECMAGMSAKSHNTYKRVFDDLVEWGFILVIKKSKNQHQCNIVALSKFDKATDKALDKANANHLTTQLTYSKTTNHKPQTSNMVSNEFDHTLTPTSEVVKPKPKPNTLPQPAQGDILDYMIEYTKSKNQSFAKSYIETESAKMFNYYESKGWIVGKSPMKNWKAAARNWLLNSQNSNNFAATSSAAERPTQTNRTIYT